MSGHRTVSFRFTNGSLRQATVEHGPTTNSELEELASSRHTPLSEIAVERGRQLAGEKCADHGSSPDDQDGFPVERET
jgi:hypothetical protein